MATRRGYFRSEIIRANVDLSSSTVHLVRVRDAYAEQHPEVSEAIQMVLDAIVKSVEVLQTVHDSI